MLRCFAVLVLLLLPVSLRAQGPAYASDPKFQKEVAAARAPKQLIDEQIGHWKKANRLPAGSA